MKSKIDSRPYLLIEVMISEAEFSFLLQLYPALTQLPTQLLGEFERDAYPLDILPDQLLFDTGSNCQSFLFLTSGSLNIFTYEESRQILLFKNRPGEWNWLAATCLLASRAHLASGIALESSSGVCISRQLFVQLVLESKAIRSSLFNSYAEGLFRFMALIREVSFQQIDQRLAANLVKRGDRIMITHQQLADELGSVREVVSRILRDFEERGFLRRERRHIQILDRAALEELAKR
jgi:CRP/FNR family transcriptional regulator